MVTGVQTCALQIWPVPTEGAAVLVQRTLMFVAGRAAAPSVGAGLIGYGAIAQAHPASIAATPGLSMAAVCEVSEDRRGLAAREWAVRKHARIEGRLDDAALGLGGAGPPPSIHATT